MQERPPARLEIASSLEPVPATEWNRLTGGASPFLRHEFLVALERNACIGEPTGWSPRYLLARGVDGDLVGALPMYGKAHSFGEFVFDWAWADAYARFGHAYYPKLVVAVPFTPVTGPRLLTGATSPGALAETLADGAIAHARERALSSVHWLFPPHEEAALLQRHGMMLRAGCQFHWHNPGYRDFDDFLDALRSKRRKQIRRERREAANSGIEVEVLQGHEVSEGQWETYERFYRSTFDRKWGAPSLTRGFFKEIGRTLPDSVVLALAARRDRYVAGALFLRGGGVLYGRHWGCSEYHRALHFELCYYRGIEYCIRHGLARFEAGAQGEHKIWRGFLPVRTWSVHWIRHRAFRDAIGEFLEHERRAVERYVAELQRHAPYPGTHPAEHGPPERASARSAGAPN